MAGLSQHNVQLWPYIVVSLGVGVLGSLFTGQGVNSQWYQSMPKAPIQPANWFFTVIWTIIYIVLGYAAYKGYSQTGNPIFNYVFALNLALNLLWCYVFFVMKNAKLALAIIMLLLLTTIWLVVLLWNVDRTSSYLLFIYVGWLLVATYLNYYYIPYMSTLVQ